MKIQKFPLLAILTLLLYSCGVSDYFEYDELEVKGTATPEWILPAINAELQLNDLLEERTDTIEYVKDPSTNRQLVQFVYRDDNLVTLAIDELYEMPEFAGVNKSVEVGNIEIPEDKRSVTKTFQEIVNDVSNPAAKNILQQATNFGIPEPGFDPVPAGSVNIDGIDNFEKAKFISGSIDITITNNMPFPIEIELQLFDNFFNRNIGPKLTYTLAAGTNSIKTVPLAGVTISNQLVGTLVGFGSSGDNNVKSVDADNDKLKIDVKVNKSQIESGSAKLPETPIDAQSFFVSIGDGTDMEIKQVVFKSGNAVITVKSDLPVVLDTKIKLPAFATKGDIDTRLDFRNSRTQKITIPFDNETADLTNGGTTVNYFYVEMQATVRESTEYVEFTNTSAFQIEANFNGIEFGNIIGNFGKMDYAIDANTFDLEADALDMFDGKLKIEDPRFKINVSNKGIGIPLRVALDLERKNGVKVSNIINIDAAPASATEPVVQTIVLDKTTPNFVDLFTLPFESIAYSGTCSLIPVTGGDQFVKSDAEVKIGGEVELPLHLTLENFALVDTIEADLTTDELVEDITSASLIIKVQNGFPLGLGFNLNFLNENEDQIFMVDPSPSSDFDIEAASTTNGVVAVDDLNESTVTIELTADQVVKLNKVKMIEVAVKLQTSNNEAAKIYTDYKINFTIAIKAGVALDLADLED